VSSYSNLYFIRQVSISFAWRKEKYLPGMSNLYVPIEFFGPFGNVYTHPDILSVKNFVAPTHTVTVDGLLSVEDRKVTVDLTSTGESDGGPPG
jgi:hypothetical protein